MNAVPDHAQEIRYQGMMRPNQNPKAALKWPYLEFGGCHAIAWASEPKRIVNADVNENDPYCFLSLDFLFLYQQAISLTYPWSVVLKNLEN